MKCTNEEQMMRYGAGAGTGEKGWGSNNIRKIMFKEARE
jgi:hypothetical protein